MVDVITTFIWQVSVVHSIDHSSVETFFCRRLGECYMQIEIPYEPYSNFEFWTKIAEDRKIPLEKIKLDPARCLITESAVEKTFTMYSIWLPFIKNFINDRSSMRYINYNFQEQKLVAFQNELLNEMEKNNEDQENETDESGDKDSGLNIFYSIVKAILRPIFCIPL